MTYPGVPSVYYGDEIGLEGGRDPDCRHCMPWYEKQWDRETLAFYRRLIALRRNNATIRLGAWHTLDDTSASCSARSLQIVGETVAEVVYRENDPRKIRNLNCPSVVLLGTERPSVVARLSCLPVARERRCGGRSSSKQVMRSESATSRFAISAGL